MIHSDRLLIRRWKESDLIPFRSINADPRVLEFFPSVLEAAESDAIVARANLHFEQFGFGLLAVELKSSQTFLGFVGLQNIPFAAVFTPAVEIGWRLAFAHWNQGYATEAARAVLRHGFEAVGLKEILALTYVGNHRSRRVMEKLGMTYNPADDFENPHPALAGHWLRPHVLYRMKALNFRD